jgi:hypothetical protein
MRIARYLIIAAALLAPGRTLLGATWSEEYSKVSVFYLYNTWNESFGDDDFDIGEGVAGVKARHVVNPRLALDLWGALTSAKYANSTPGEEGANFSALSDTRLKGTYYLGNRLFSVAVSLNLPTGKTALTDEEYLLALGVADNSRKYIVRRFGQGLDIGGEVFVLPRSGNIEFQLGAGYVAKGSYQLREATTAEYKFGNELFASAAVEIGSRPVGFEGGVIFTSYGDDEADSRVVFRQGKTIVVHGRLFYIRELQGAVGFTLISRGPAKTADGSGELTEESIKSGRNEMQVYASGGKPLTPAVQALVRLEYKMTGANDYDEDVAGYRPGADYLGLGGGVNARFSLAWSGNLMATYYTGGTNDDHDLTGLGLAAVLTFRYW